MIKHTMERGCSLLDENVEGVGVQVEVSFGVKPWKFWGEVLRTLALVEYTL